MYMQQLEEHLMLNHVRSLGQTWQYLLIYKSPKLELDVCGAYDAVLLICENCIQFQLALEHQTFSNFLEDL